MSVKRADGRAPDALRPITIETGVSKFAEGSARITCGDTVVLCLATVEDKVPRFLEGKNRGWITAEYAMLPRATPERSQRESMAGRPGGRTFEIQRLVGRALRTAVDLNALGPRSITIDCEVLQADGGTRTASITGGFVALGLALKRLQAKGDLQTSPLKPGVAAVSVGVVGGTPLLDLAYTEDRDAAVDLNLVMDAGGQFIELQASGEETTFSEEQLASMLALGRSGIREILALQQAAIAA